MKAMRLFSTEATHEPHYGDDHDCRHEADGYASSVHFRLLPSRQLLLYRIRNRDGVGLYGCELEAQGVDDAVALRQLVLQLFLAAG